jgi:hypothetical protein
MPPISTADFSLIVAFGFLSSLHCVGMCGPIVLSYSVAANAAAQKRSLLGLHLAYNTGRTITYMLLGALAGLAGSAMGWMGRLAGIENIAAIVAGAAMVLTAIAMFGYGFKGWRGFAVPGRLLRPAGKLISSSRPGSKFALGLLMGFLPCGLVYAALMKAAGSATALAGALTMLGFGLGTSLALVLVGLGSSALTRKAGRWGTAISAATVLVMGAILIARGALAGPVNHCSMHHMEM